MAKLERSLGSIRLAFYGVGTIVGAGIYTVIGAAAGQAGYGLLYSFMLAAIAAGLSALSYAELASTYPSAGAEFTFVKKAFPRRHWPAFLTGWTVTFHGAATIAAVLLAFGGYLRTFVDLPQLLLCYGLLLGLVAIALSGIKKSSTATVIMVLVQLAGLLVLVVVGLYAEGAPAAKQVVAAPPIDGVIAATATLFFIFTGFEHMSALSGEVKDPGRSIPRAYLLTMLFTTGTYLLIGFTVLQISVPSEIAGVDSPLSMAASNVNSWLPIVVAIAALFATANGAFSGLLAVSRLLFGMAKTRELPSAMTKTNVAHAPWVSILVVTGAVSIFLLFGDIKTVASMSSLGALLVFSAVNVSLIKLRLMKSAASGPFKVPLNVGMIPIPSVVAILISLSLATQYTWKTYAALAVAIAIGIAMHGVLGQDQQDLKARSGSK